MTEEEKDIKKKQWQLRPHVKEFKSVEPTDIKHTPKHSRLVNRKRTSD
jgi:uncharacterized coiled-coil protein SlyX